MDTNGENMFYWRQACILSLFFFPVSGSDRKGHIQSDPLLFVEIMTKNRGAKGKYKKWLEPEGLVLLEGWRRDGLDMHQIAKNCGVTRETLYNWCSKYDEISNALKKGDEVCVYEVENALYKSALGFYVEEMEIVETETALGKTVTKKKHRRYISPNTANQIFILKNRRPDKWRDSKVIETKGEGQLAALIEGLKEPEKKPDVMQGDSEAVKEEEAKEL